jgi:6-pyruvoyl-tetrahydropterin synthase
MQTGTFEIEVTITFRAAHQLRLLDGTLEPLHAHDWQLTARLGAARLDGLDTVLDFHLLQQELERIVALWRDRNLNDVPPFAVAAGAALPRNPSAERVVEHVGQTLVAWVAGLPDAAARGVAVVATRITEAPGCAAFWRAGA